MIEQRVAQDRYLAAHGWLNTFHLFSFAEYYDPNNMGFGNLRVFNDDMIVGQSGFSEHSHKDMEIITLMHEGELTHRDNMGNEKIIKAGEVQVMTAGTGVLHAEINMSERPVRLYQIWIEPSELHLKPAYAQKDFSTILKKNALTPVASRSAKGEALEIHADSTVYLGDLSTGQELTYPIEPTRGVFIYVTDGDLIIGDQVFKKGDQARIRDEKESVLKASADTKFVLIEVPFVE